MTYTHDTRGNVTGDGRNNYTWTRANRLAAATGKESYQYDGHGRRVVMWRSDGTASVPMYGLDGKLRLTADNGLGGATYHVYLGDDNVADVFSRWSDGQQTATYLHTDALGSPVVRTNQARAVTGRTVYAPYGEAVSTTGSTPANRIDYTGHAKDGATGLVYMQQRYYDPVVGRFISADPVATDPGTGAMFNRYNYANNNPYLFKDPDGRHACKFGGGALCDVYRRADDGPRGGAGCARTCIGGDKKLMGNLTERKARAATREVEEIVGEPGGSLSDFDDQVHEVIQGYASRSPFEFHAVYGQRTVTVNGESVTQYGAQIQTQGSHVASFGVKLPRGFKALEIGGRNRTMHNHGGSGMRANEIDLLARPDIVRPGSRLQTMVPGQTLDEFSQYDNNPNGLLSHPGGIRQP